MEPFRRQVMRRLQPNPEFRIYKLRVLVEKKVENKGSQTAGACGGGARGAGGNVFAT